MEDEHLVQPAGWADLIRQCQASNMDGIAVGAFIEDSFGRVLILRRADGEFKAGLYDLPSGGVEPGETLSVALQREVWEETGLRVSKLVRYVCAFDYRTAAGYIRQLNFLAQVRRTEPLRLSEEHQDWAWVSRYDAAMLAALDQPMREQLSSFFGQSPQ